MISQRLPGHRSSSPSSRSLVAIAVAVPAGRRDRRSLTTGRPAPAARSWRSPSSSVVLAAIPDFLLGVGLVYVFAVSLGWLPVAGRTGADVVRPAGAGARARPGRGAGPHRPRRDARRAARPTTSARPGPSGCPPGASTCGTRCRTRSPRRSPSAACCSASLVAGTVLVENVFAWPGLGSTIVQSILAKDYPVVQGIVLVYGVGVLLVNTVVDVALAVLDPRSTIRGARCRVPRWQSQWAQDVRGRRSGRPPRSLLAARARCSPSSRPILWSDAGQRRRHRAPSCAGRRRRTGSAPTTWAATSSSGSSSPPGSRSSWHCSRRRSAVAGGLVLGTAPVAARRAAPGGCHARWSTSPSRSPGCCSPCSSP